MPATKVECIAYRRTPHPEFLLLKRISERGSFWQPVSGGLESESLLEGALRELEEETAITRSSILTIHEDFHTFVMRSDTGETTEHVFAFEVDPDVKVSIERNIYPEHDEFRWVSFEEALILLKWENNKDALRKLRGLIE